MAKSTKASAKASEQRPAKETLEFSRVNLPNTSLFEFNRGWKYDIRDLNTIRMTGDRKTNYSAKSREPQVVFAFPIYHSFESLSEKAVQSYVLQSTDGRPINLYQGPDLPPKPEKRIVIGTTGILNKWALEHWETAERIYKVEGLSDMLVLQNFIPEEFREKHLVITNACGCKDTKPAAWLAPRCAEKEIVIIHDADIPGQDGAESWLGALAGMAKSLKNVQLPYEVASTHGKDLRNWINEPGRKYADLQELVNTASIAATIIEANFDSSTKSCATAGQAWKPIKNFRMASDHDGKPSNVPLPIQDIYSALMKQTDGWPKVCQGVLFTNSGDGPVYLRKSADLFAWIGFVTNCPPDFSRESSFHSKDELMSHLHMAAEKFDAIERIPHEPPMPNVFYMTPSLPQTNGEYLEALVSRFQPASDEDKHLIKALFLTTLWGGEPGSRPAFLLTADGRGAGKTTLAEICAEISGGCLSFGTKDDPIKIRQRLLSPEGRSKRVCLIDNLKGFRYSSDSLEGLITAKTISGQQLYVGEGSRPNSLTWVITSNSPGLGRDVAQRVVNIQLRKTDYSADWKSQTLTMLRQHFWEIIADIIALLRSPNLSLKAYSRWAEWEGAVLSKLPAAGSLQAIIRVRQENLDTETEEAGDVEDMIRGKLTGLGYGRKQPVFISNAIMRDWFNEMTNEHHTTSRVTRRVKQMIEEKQITQIQAGHSANASERGFRWMPPDSDALPVDQSLR